MAPLGLGNEVSSSPTVFSEVDKSGQMALLSQGNGSTITRRFFGGCFLLWEICGFIRPYCWWQPEIRQTHQFSWGWQLIPLFYKGLFMPSGAGFLNHQQYEWFIKHHVIPRNISEKQCRLSLGKGPLRCPWVVFRRTMDVFDFFCINKSATKETTDEFSRKK